MNVAITYALDVTASVVVYRSEPDELTPLFAALARENLAAWVLVDNAAVESAERSAEMRAAVESSGGQYLATPRNIGFGAGHNLALQALAGVASNFHALVNPDILFEPGTLRVLARVLDEHAEVGLLMPGVIFPDGSPQLMCRLLPSPLDFALRRFAPSPVKRLFAARLARYELQGLPETPCDKVPFLSGCFLFARRSMLEGIGGFDQRYFLYLEDVDLCRRMAEVAKLLYWPEVRVIHGCVRGAYRSRKLMWMFIRSSVAYFNRWGWMFDRTRRAANSAAVECLARGNGRA